MKNILDLDQMKKAKLQWLQDPNQCNVDNLNNVRSEDSRHCGGRGGGEISESQN
jgi:hypothetical protein